MLRIFFSTAVLHKYWGIYLAADHLAVEPTTTILMEFILILGGFCLIGLLTPISLVFLNVLVVYTDKKLGIYSLGTAGLSNVAFLLFFVQAGYTLSLDRILTHRMPLLQVFYPASWRSAQSLKASLLLAFVIFGLVNLASVAGHLLDPFWLNGQALQVTFQNPFYSNYFEQIGALARAYPNIYGLICILAEFLQIAWQLFMIPFLWFRWGRIFVCTWGVIFIGLSFVILKLSYLSYFLLILWFALFWKSSFWNNTRVQPAKSEQFKSIIKQPSTILAAPFIAFFLAASIVSASHLIVARLKMQNTQDFRYDLLKQRLPSLVLKSYDLAATVGLLTPNVFNTPDVLAAEHFVLLERRINGATNWELVPFIGYNGERLEYNSNDLIYYGVSIPLRRCIQVKPLNECSVFVEKVIAYDKSIDKITEADYRVVLSKNQKLTFKLIR